MGQSSARINHSMQTTNKFIYGQLKDELEKYKNFDQPKLVICFSGIPGSGKTTLAAELEKKLKAIRVSNDDIRSVIESDAVTNRDQREDLKEKFLDWFFVEVKKWPNGTILLDSGIDRRYLELKQRFNDYKFFVISIEISKELAIERLKARQGHRSKLQPMLDSMDRWITDKKEFDNKYSSEVDYRIDASMTHDVDMLIDEIVALL